MKQPHLSLSRERGSRCLLSVRLGMLFFILSFLVSAPLSAQASEQGSISLNVRNATIQQVVAMITNSTDYDLVYRASDLPATPVRDYDFRNASISQVMDRLLEGTQLTWSESEGIISISRRSAAQPPQQEARHALSGVVTDASSGQPVAGATVAITGTTTGTVTDANGRYSLAQVAPRAVVEVRFIGYRTHRAEVGESTTLDVALEVETTQIEMVVIDGATARRAESYTGNIAVFSRDDLQRVGNSNIFESLRNLEPALYFPTDFTMGSDPNTLPEMTLRGGTSFFDVDAMESDNTFRSSYENAPNAPLFIMDGFQVSPERVFDLNMNNIESITILKDASAKALYGSKAANGVIVIQSKPLRSDEPRVTYSGSVDLQMPDLSSYDMTNAMEKLDVEFRELYFPNSDNDLNVDMLDEYYAKRKMVLEGLDTDWLSKPVRYGYGHKHNLDIEMGMKDLRVRAYGSYNNVVGVMKGSERTSVSTGMNLNWNYKNFRLYNSLDYSNTQEFDSPYGKFEDYTKLNPYESPYNEYGQLRPTVGNHPNYYYDGHLKTEKKSGYDQINNNTEFQYRVLPELNLRGRFGFTVDNRNASDYRPATHSSQINLQPADERGNIKVANERFVALSGSLSLNYIHTFGDGHTFIGNAMFDMRQERSNSVEQTAVGLPSDNMNSILYALKYNSEARPKGKSTLMREMGGLLILSYSYNDRYAADLTLRTNATSIFGVNNRWAPFWSFGVLWNMHKESFINNENIRELKLSASVGTSGNQNFSNNRSLAVYQYLLGDRYFGYITDNNELILTPGALAGNMENPNLKWERKMEYNVGLKTTLYGLSLDADAYIAYTKDAVSVLSTALSTGYARVNQNVGELRTKGFEVKASYQLIRRGSNYLNIFANVAGERRKIIAISDQMQSYNDAILAAYDDMDNADNASIVDAPPILYYEGANPDALWMVRSMGIDPSTGLEIFIGRDGLPTYIYKASDMQPTGSELPRFHGNFGFNGEWRGFGLSVTLNYLGGGQYFNRTLRDRVENVSITDNFDRRVLTDRWAHIDQASYFKGYSIISPYDFGSGVYNSDMISGPVRESTKYTDRFVQNRNELSIASVSLSYRMPQRVLKALKMQDLKVSLYMNDVATFSTIGIERGTTYPFARKVSMSLTATF